MDKLSNPIGPESKKMVLRHFKKIPLKKIEVAPPRGTNDGDKLSKSRTQNLTKGDILSPKISILGRGTKI